uniref:Uncharacterized protein n=1 Tax=Lepeophtheirus salmonis TaxID=72036 RepID=A0A0K2U7K6_LEPSM
MGSVCCSSPSRLHGQEIYEESLFLTHNKSKEESIIKPVDERKRSRPLTPYSRRPLTSPFVLTRPSTTTIDENNAETLEHSSISNGSQ